MLAVVDGFQCRAAGRDDVLEHDDGQTGHDGAVSLDEARFGIVKRQPSGALVLLVASVVPLHEFEVIHVIAPDDVEMIFGKWRLKDCSLRQ